MQKKNRNQLHKVRLTEDELELFKAKAQSFSSVSSMIRKAVECLDDREKKNKIDLLEEFSTLLHQYDVQFSHVSGNLNQVVKQANQLAIGGVLGKSFFEKALYPQIVEVNKHILEIKKMQKSIFSKLLKL